VEASLINSSNSNGQVVGLQATRYNLAPLGGNVGLDGAARGPGGRVKLRIGAGSGKRSAQVDGNN